LELGYEYCYGRFSSQISAAYLFNSTVFVYNSLSGYNLKYEEKFFIKKRLLKNRIKLYTSVEICYNYINQNKNRLFVPAEYDDLSRTDKEQYAYTGKFDLQNKAFVAHVKFGTQIKPRKIKNLLFEPCGGIGVNFQNVVHYNRNPDDSFFYPMGSLFPVIRGIKDKEGESVLPNFTFAFRIGYIF
jgi:hypothetical protein